MSKKSKGLSRNYALVVYNLDDLKKIISDKDKIRRYAYILHDKDVVTDSETGEVTPKQAHYHLYVNMFNNSRISWLDTMKKTQGFAENVLIEKCASPEELITYFTHVYELEKHKYEMSDIVSNFDLKKLSNETELSEHLDIYLEIEKIVRSNGRYRWSDLFRRYPRLIYSANSLKAVASFLSGEFCSEYRQDLKQRENFERECNRTYLEPSQRPKPKKMPKGTKSPFDPVK